MAEDAFARFRRLRRIAPPVSVQEEIQQGEGAAPVSPLALLQQLHTPGVKLTPALLDAMRQCKAELHALGEACEECASMMEHDAGLERPVAYALAWECMGREAQRWPCGPLF
jgi:hypothetical protein